MKETRFNVNNFFFGKMDKRQMKRTIKRKVEERCMERDVVELPRMLSGLAAKLSLTALADGVRTLKLPEEHITRRGGGNKSL